MRFKAALLQFLSWFPALKSTYLTQCDNLSLVLNSIRSKLSLLPGQFQNLFCLVLICKKKCEARKKKSSEGVRECRDKSMSRVTIVTAIGNSYVFMINSFSTDGHRTLDKAKWALHDLRAALKPQLSEFLENQPKQLRSYPFEIFVRTRSTFLELTWSDLGISAQK